MTTWEKGDAAERVVDQTDGQAVAVKVERVHRDGTVTVKCLFALRADGTAIPGSYLGCRHRYPVEVLRPSREYLRGVAAGLLPGKEAPGELV